MELNLVRNIIWREYKELPKFVKSFCRAKKIRHHKNDVIKDWAEDILFLEEISEYEFIEISNVMLSLSKHLSLKFIKQIFRSSFYKL